MTYKVVQWATGNVGIEALRGILQHPELELVGLLAHGEAKDGKDAGTLCGMPPAGVVASRDKEAILALELAEFLSKRHRRVSIVDEPPVMGAGLAYVRRTRLLTELHEHGVEMFPAASNIHIGQHAVLFTDGAGQARDIPADQVIVAKGAAGDAQLADSLRRAGLDVRAIGDCMGMGYIEGAMHGAAKAVRELLA